MRERGMIAREEMENMYIIMVSTVFLYGGKRIKSGRMEGKREVRQRKKQVQTDK